MPHFEDSIINENVSVATEYFRTLVASNIKDAQNNQKQSAGSIGFIPYGISFTIDGLSGIKIYNELHVDTGFLPPGYTKTTDFIVTGIDHNIQNGDWETNINLTLIPKTSPITNVITSSLTFASQTEEARVDTPPTAPTLITSPSSYTNVQAAVLTGEQKKSNIKIIAEYLKSIGLTKEGTIGLIGNILGESQANPTAIERKKEPIIGGKGGIGLVQWTASRRRKLEKQANNDAAKIVDINFQLQYLGNELKQSYSGVFNKLKTSTSVEESTITVLEKFEVPGTYLNRLKNPTAYESTKKLRISYAKSVIEIVNEVYA